MLSPTLPITALGARYSDLHRVAIPNFLAPRAARGVYAALHALGRRDLWKPMHHGSPWARPGRGRAGAARTFSYRYETFVLRDKGQPITRSAPAALVRLAARFDAPSCLRLLSSVTGHDLAAGRTEVNATRYLPGDYLQPHDDGISSRRAAFVLSLTPQWPVSWGGQLMVLGADWTTVVDTYTPCWNTLVLFDVPLPHAVVTVAPYARAPRYAISGWVHAAPPRRGR